MAAKTSPKANGRFSEKALSLLWQRMATTSQALVTEDQLPKQVLYPGRFSSQAGPDFRDAVLRTSKGELIRGDVEIHLESSEWESHGHHLDRHYNGVVLHAVLSSNGEAGSVQESGMVAPVVTLEPAPLESLSVMPESELLRELRVLKDKELGHRIDMAGDERFLAKSQGFALELAREEGEEVLYRGVMEALGYANNRKPFLELAHKVPMKALSSLAEEPPSTRLLAFKALLLGAAGLLSSSDTGDRDLTSVRRWLPHVEATSSPWQLFRVRPGNHPRRRILGAAHLIDRHIKKGLVRGLLTLMLMERPSYLTRGLMASPFLGQGRAREIAVNAVLPFFYAWGQVAREKSIALSSLQMYYRYPPLSENEITREMARLLFRHGRSPLINSARRHQGLIHLYKDAIMRWETKPEHP